MDLAPPPSCRRSHALHHLEDALLVDAVQKDWQDGRSADGRWWQVVLTSEEATPPPHPHHTPIHSSATPTPPHPLKNLGHSSSSGCHIRAPSPSATSCRPGGLWVTGRCVTFDLRRHLLMEVSGAEDTAGGGQTNSPSRLRLARWHYHRMRQLLCEKQQITSARQQVRRLSSVESRN